ncbi:nucleotide disphospho-sugar-binding domain-containing protein [Streptomyces sp. RGM 3693]|uniref:nucleotide disphospho-sugar-binding domain-containing protein n=1 Tax=Streptomyces sp. RGM 3693 TaxID=3413284 RepID=UPI003D2B9690
MRILVCCTHAVSHVFPTVSLAWALRAAGHEVAYAAAQDGLVARSAGFPVIDVLPHLTMAELFGKFAQERPDLMREIEQGIPDLKGAVPGFAYLCSQLTDGTVAAAEAFRPDLILHSEMNGAALIAAAKLGVPAVEQGFGFADATGIPELLAEHMTDAADRHGVTGLPERRATIEVTPPSMAAGSGGWTMRCVPYNGGGVLPEWLTRRPERPRIGVTFGTVSSLTNGLGPLQQVIEAAPEFDAEFVCALTEAEIEGLGTLPDNVRTASWLPLNALLDTCTAALHHGGAASTLTALHTGLPQVALPGGGYRSIYANAMARRGVGLVSPASGLDTALIGRLLTDRSLYEAAGEVRAEIAAMPSPAELVPRLADLAGA